MQSTPAGGLKEREIVHGEVGLRALGGGGVRWLGCGVPGWGVGGGETPRSPLLGTLRPPSSSVPPASRTRPPSRPHALEYPVILWGLFSRLARGGGGGERGVELGLGTGLVPIVWAWEGGERGPQGHRRGCCPLKAACVPPFLVVWAVGAARVGLASPPGVGQGVDPVL